MTALPLLLLALAQDGDRLLATIPEDVKVGHLAFSADGRVAAYAAWKGDRCQIVAGTWKSKSYGVAACPILSRNGKDVIFMASHERNSIVCLNDSVLLETTREWTWSLPGAVSSDFKTTAQVVHSLDATTSAVVLDGKIQKIHSGIAQPPVLSENGKVFAFALEKKGDHSIVVNDTQGPIYDWVTNPVLSADGKITAYGAETPKEEFLVIHGDRKILVKTVPTGVFLSQDGASVGYWRVHRKEGNKKIYRVSVGEKEGPEFAGINSGPVFSLDAAHVAYRATGLDGKKVVVMDGRTFEAPDIESAPVFLDGGKRVGYGARKGRELWWRTIEVP